MAHKYPALAIKNQNTEEIELKFEDDVEEDTKKDKENKENQEAAKEIKEKTKEII